MWTDMFSGYEKQIENLESENEKLNYIAYNAIDYMICEAGMTIEEICDYLCCTEEDLRNNGLIKEDE